MLLALYLNNLNLIRTLMMDLRHGWVSLNLFVPVPNVAILKKPPFSALYHYLSLPFTVIYLCPLLLFISLTGQLWGLGRWLNG